jgi:hypothetical protein
METNIEKKILRFVELSKEFSKKPEELGNYIENSSLHFVTETSNIGLIQLSPSYCSTRSCQTNTSKSPLERFKEDKKEEIKKAERWYEFVELRNDLNSYFSAKNELNK